MPLESSRFGLLLRVLSYHLLFQVKSLPIAVVDLLVWVYSRQLPTNDPQKLIVLPDCSCAMPTSTPSVFAKHERDQIQDFDECVILLSMLGPSLSLQSQLSATDFKSREPQTKWHLFLDQLSWLCDYKTSGKTVASVAAESETSGTTFYLSSNSASVSKATKHLKWVLGEIKIFVAGPGANSEETQRRLFQRSVSFSRERVAFYSQKLQELVRSSRSLRQDSHAGDLQPLRLRNYALSFTFRSSTF